MMDLWFQDWSSLLRILVHGVLGYVALILVLRISGSRTLSKMNAFDFVVTIALGSTFATLVLDDSIPLVNGVAALALLIGLQWTVSSIYVRSEWFENLVKTKPQLVYWRGDFEQRAMRRVRVTRAEILAAMRSGETSAPERTAVVLEADGTLTVVELGSDVMPYPMQGVEGVRRSDQPD
ncbi:MAG TPA: YetF domain-containing protein [Acidimicrobiia bacterium]|nr:YetF domain-containing protein [Acidimicrobiia bacterium]